jgi:DNA topoisomerase IA
MYPRTGTSRMKEGQSLTQLNMSARTCHSILVTDDNSAYQQTEKQKQLDHPTIKLSHLRSRRD